MTKAAVLLTEGDALCVSKVLRIDLTADLVDAFSRLFGIRVITLTFGC